uniref:Macaca fascicularis brain cDNA clone: QflA-22635, similar to human cytoplasmic FMR1 interacting protein 2 (CYFIP2), mRNA, RefSeq: NM_014376.1 n=1 Tax=Macaca fascicularis TaxID=9541 RepID=I7GNW2_MACFA|nr:unnamed protein product [Macaca fascicularis]
MGPRTVLCGLPFLSPKNHNETNLPTSSLITFMDPSLSTLPTATSTAPTGILWGHLISRLSADSWVTRASLWSWRNC